MHRLISCAVSPSRMRPPTYDSPPTWMLTPIFSRSAHQRRRPHLRVRHAAKCCLPAAVQAGLGVHHPQPDCYCTGNHHSCADAAVGPSVVLAVVCSHATLLSASHAAGRRLSAEVDQKIVTTLVDLNAQLLHHQSTAATAASSCVLPPSLQPCYWLCHSYRKRQRGRYDLCNTPQSTGH
jgi:hypothetical protein